MNFVLDRRQTIQSLTRVCGVVGKSPIMPILSNAVVKVTDNEISLFATNLRVWANIKIPAIKINEPGECCVNPRILLDIAKKSTAPEIKFSSDDKSATIKSGKSKFKLAIHPVGEFPQSPAIDDTVSPITISAQDIISCIGKIKSLMDNTVSRQEISGVLLEVKSDFIHFVATNGAALGHTGIKVSNDSVVEFNAIIPRDVVFEIEQCFKSLSPNSLISVSKFTSDGHLFFNAEDINLVVETINGTYPDYKAVVPEKTEKNAVLDLKEFKSAVDRIGIIALQKQVPFVEISFSDGNVELDTLSEAGNASEYVGADCKSSDAVIKFDYNLVQSVLKGYSDGKMSIGYNGKSTPTVIKNDKYPFDINVIMPLAK